MKKTILGLDVGTNSIGWALIEINHSTKTLRIITIGSRIIPMDGQELSNFNSGVKIQSAAANRTEKHRARITKERYLLRRDRLHLVLNLLEALPEHYKIEIDFERNGKKCGQFKAGKEPKIAYIKERSLDDKFSFYYEDAFNEMIADLQKVNPELKNEKGKRVPKDWTIYYLRTKALKEKISLEELAWVLLSYNQKRGYEKMEVEDENEKPNEIKESLDLQVENVTPKEDENGKYFEVVLNDTQNFTYKEYSTKQLTFKDDIKEIVKVSYLDEEGNEIPEKNIYEIADFYTLKLSAIQYEELNTQKKKYQYIYILENGWQIEKTFEKRNYSIDKLMSNIDKKIYEDDYVVRTKYDVNGNIVKSQGKERSIKLPDFSGENSKDWTLLKKKTEKDTIAFNIKNGFVNKDNTVQYVISPRIYDLLQNDAKNGEKTKIIGGLFQTIERKFYRNELYEIISTQRKFHNEQLDSKEIFEKCVKLLYPHNENHAKTLLENKNAIAHLLIDDILLYQRPLKSKKSEISDCKYEIDYWKEEVNTNTGEVIEIPVYKKATSVSHPLYQEYRIWDKIHNIKLIQLEQHENGKTTTNVDVTEQYFENDDDYLALFEFFNNKKIITQNHFLEFCKKRFGIDIGKKENEKFVWNYPADEEFKGNETKKSFEIRFKRCGFRNVDEFLTQEKEIELWHYLYSVNYKERNAVGKLGNTSIHNFFKKYFKDFEIENNVFDKIVNDFANFPNFNSKYGAFSVKALKKILTFMRPGNNFLTEDFRDKLQEGMKVRAEKILEKINQVNWDSKDIDFEKVTETNVDFRKGELPFPKGLINTFKDFSCIEDFRFLNLTQASYFIYGRHSELAFAKYWRSPDQLREGLSTELKYNSLNNPVAEKVLKEMIKVVADLWEYYGESSSKYFNQINIEVARELQKTNSEKAEISKNQKSNRNENNRLRSILEEFLSKSPYNAKKENQDHFERLKILEDSVKYIANSDKNFYEKNKDKFSKKDIDDLLKKQKISKSDFEKYKLWIEQGYRSPYTGEMILLSNLFNGNLYNIDHIFSRATTSNDSLNNKVVCEAFINRHKSDQTGRGYISTLGGKEHTIFDEYAGREITFSLLDEDSYVDLVKRQFNGNKRFILLANEVPDGFTNSQLNNAKHIARKAMELLSHIVREEGEVEFRSKNVLPVTGAITDKLKKEWKLNHVWTKLLTPRFERLNELKKTNDFGAYTISESGHPYFEVNTKFILEENKNFELKRLDHRHHALDALVVALCTENHVQYFNNVNSGITNKKKNKIEAVKKQRAGIKRQIMYCEFKKENPKEKVWKFLLPGAYRLQSETNDKTTVQELKWSNEKLKPTDDFKNVILNSLEHCIVTFKNDFKLVSKTSNKYESYYTEDGNLRIDSNGKPQKDFISQKNEDNKHWGIRKTLHTDNPSGKITSQHERLKIIDNIGKSHLIIDENVKDAVNEVLGMFDNKIGEARKYLVKNPITMNGEIVEVVDFKTPNIKNRKRQPITELSKRTGTGALPDLKSVKDRIYKVADIKLRNELLEHLSANANDIDIAFSIEGITDFNRKRKIPVHNLPIAESASLKFPIGVKNKNNHQWVETGGNFHFRISVNNGKREYETIPLRKAIEMEKRQILNKFGAVDSNEIVLSPNDLVYIPTKDEVSDLSAFLNNELSLEQKRRIYKFVSCTEKEAHFVPNSNSSEIIKNENGTNSKSERIQNYFDGEIVLDEKGNEVQIKSVCWKLETNRLGKITKVIK